MVHAQEIDMDEERGYNGLFYIMMALGLFGLIGLLAMAAGGGL